MIEKYRGLRELGLSPLGAVKSMFLASKLGGAYYVLRGNAVIYNATIRGQFTITTNHSAWIANNHFIYQGKEEE